MDLSELRYSINSYDSDSDISEEGIFLHFGKTRIKVAEDIDGYQLFLQHLQAIKDEIEVEQS